MIGWRCTHSKDPKPLLEHNGYALLSVEHNSLGLKSVELFHPPRPGTKLPVEAL